MQSRIGKEVTVEDVTSGRTVSESQLKELGGELFECNKAHNDALVRVMMGRKYPRRVLVVNDVIISVKIDDRGFVVHKWTRKIADLKQVCCVRA